MVAIKDTENTTIYNQSRTEASLFNITDLKGFTNYIISVDAINNQKNWSRNERNFISVELCMFYVCYFKVLNLWRGRGRVWERGGGGGGERG